MISGFTLAFPSANNVSCTVHCLFSRPDPPPLTQTVLSPVSAYIAPSAKQRERRLINIGDLVKFKLSYLSWLLTVKSDLADSLVERPNSAFLVVRWLLANVCRTSETDAMSLLETVEPSV